MAAAAMHSQLPVGNAEECWVRLLVCFSDRASKGAWAPAAWQRKVNRAGRACVHAHAHAHDHAHVRGRGAPCGAPRQARVRSFHCAFRRSGCGSPSGSGAARSSRAAPARHRLCTPRARQTRASRGALRTARNSRTGSRRWAWVSSRAPGRRLWSRASSGLSRSGECRSRRSRSGCRAKHRRSGCRRRR